VHQDLTDNEQNDLCGIEPSLVQVVEERLSRHEEDRLVCVLRNESREYEKVIYRALG
jgi:hypothetical protein